MADPLNISSIGPQSIRPDNPLSPPSSNPSPGASFKDILADAVGEVQRLNDEADSTIRKLVAGEITDVTETMVAVERADVAFQTMMAVRNKMVQAYEEVMRMQV